MENTADTTVHTFGDASMPTSVMTVPVGIDLKTERENGKLIVTLIGAGSADVAVAERDGVVYIGTPGDTITTVGGSIGSSETVRRVRGGMSF